MPLSERSRSALFTRLTQLVEDEEAVAEMLSNFPSRDVEEPATKDHLRAEFAIYRAEMQSEFAAVRSDMGSLRVELHDALRSQTRWLVGAMVSTSGVFAAVSATAVSVAG